MCSICNAENVVHLGDDFFSAEEIQSFIEKIFNGVITPDHLDVAQYIKMSRKMSESIEKGYGKKLDELTFLSEEYGLLKAFISDAYRFCAAKQYQLVLAICDLINHKLETRQEYYDMAKVLFLKFNMKYFNAELDSAEYQAKGAVEFRELILWNNG